MESSQETPKLTQSDENSPSVDFNKTKWNCVTSEKFLACYFEHFKEEEENEDGTVRSKPMEDKKLVCSPEEYQQSFSILWQNTWRYQFCDCFKCLKLYDDHNVNFQFGIKNIESLPTEILLMIFTQLLSSDRRVVSECCKRFLEIWLCDDFIDDRHRLVFNKCVLDPQREPLSVFMKSSRIYRTLVFGDEIIRGESVFAGRCWENVTTIELMSDPYKYFNKNLPLLSQFPNLKTIKANHCQLEDYSNVPTTIELLVFSVNYISEDQLFLLKSYLDRKSDSFRVELDFQISTEEILNFTESQRNKIQRVTLCFDDVDKTFKLPRFDNLKYLKLYFKDSCDFGTEDILDNLEEQCPALKDLSINIFNRLPHKNWTCLTTLTARGIPKEEMSRLSIFENLNELTLELNDECFFVHEAFLNKNLKELKIDSCCYDSCFTCFQTMTKSFPNLESLTCYPVFTNNHLEELAANTPKLKSLNLARVDASVSIACLPNLTELKISNSYRIHDIEALPFMLRLRRLDFSLSCLNYKTVKIFERMPALENLRINCYFIDGDQLALIDALTKPLKRLTKICFNCNRIQDEIYHKIIDAMANNCKYLRRIDFPIDKTRQSSYEEDISEDILKQLLQKHSSIWCIDGVWLK